MPSQCIYSAAIVTNPHKTWRFIKGMSNLRVESKRKLYEKTKRIKDQLYDVQSVHFLIKYDESQHIDGCLLTER